MRLTRRHLLIAGGAAAVALAEPRVIALGQTRPPTIQPMPSPNAPQNQNAPTGLDTDIPVNGEGRPLAPAKWVDIKSDAQKILDIATDFKWQVDKANLSATLPLLLLQEAHSLEKLAKQVQQRMRG
jgi:hypothetical protein